MQKKLISNLFMFISNRKLYKNGYNNISNKFLKRLKLTNKIPVNLFGEIIYKIKLKNV